MGIYELIGALTRAAALHGNQTVVLTIITETDIVEDRYGLALDLDDGVYSIDGASFPTMVEL